MRSETTDEPRRASPVQRAIGAVREQQSSLEQAVDELVKRLGPILSPDSSVPGDDPGETDRPPGSTVAEELHSVADRLDNYRSVIVHVLDRLEV